MSMLDWSNIKDGFSGFEELARIYVAERYPASSKWEKTPATRDGNKDAVVIFGFQPYPLQSEQWWMEAKYSTKTERLTRYRLDATIVSAVLEGNVTKIIFVTNINVNPKTISDIRSALLSSIGCYNVDFCTKSTLEYWLHNNPEIYKDFFDSAPDFELPSLFITNELDVYPVSNQQLCFTEPISYLRRGTKYIGYCSIFSSSEKDIAISTSLECNRLLELEDTRITLIPGETPVGITFSVNNQYDIADESTQISHLFNINGIPVMSKLELNVLCGQVDIKIKSQKNILSDLNRAGMEFNNNLFPQFHYIEGRSGSGKTYMLNEIMRKKSLLQKKGFLITFTDKEAANDLLFLYIILHILFPFISPRDIDKEYIKKINTTNYITPTVLQLIAAKDDHEKLHNLISKEFNKQDCFPLQMEIKHRILLLDNVHKLKEDHYQALVSLLKECHEKNIPILFIMCSQPLQNNFLNLMKYELPLKQHNCRLDVEDITVFLKKNYSFDFAIESVVSRELFPSFIELFIFAQHLDDIYPEIQTLQDFILACHTFSNGHVYHSYMLKQFQSAFSYNELIKQICGEIYWSASGTNFDSSDNNIRMSLQHLLAVNLIKLDENGMFIPVHDKYVIFYRKKYPRQPHRLGLQTYDELVSLNETLLFDIIPTTLYKAVDKIIELTDKRKFFSTMHILEDVFEENRIEELKSRLGDELFYPLYLCYAYALTNTSKNKSGKAYFEEIVSHTITLTSPRTQFACLRSIFELVNSCYEWLETQKSLSYIEKLQNQLERMSKLGLVDKDLKKRIEYHNANVIATLIASDQEEANVDLLYKKNKEEMDNYGFDYRSQTFEIRYALTLAMRDTTNCIIMLNSGMKNMLANFGDREKFYLGSVVDYNYLMLNQDNDANRLKKKETTLGIMRNETYNDYRKRIFAMAIYYYLIGEEPKGNQYLFSESYVQRDLRPRQKGFYYQALALHEMLFGSRDTALKHLCASSVIFKNHPTYNKIIKHNIDLLNKNIKIDKYSFCLNCEMPDNNYLLDPRCLW